MESKDFTDFHTVTRPKEEPKSFSKRADRTKKEAEYFKKYKKRKYFSLKKTE